jgi:hypothetical protein
VTRITPIWAVIADPSARHQHRHQHRPEFADDAEAEDVHDEHVGPEELQLQRRQIRQHPDQEAHQR